jgi:hypothetical protein
VVLPAAQLPPPAEGLAAAPPEPPPPVEPPPAPPPRGSRVRRNQAEAEAAALHDVRLTQLHERHAAIEEEIAATPIGKRRQMLGRALAAIDHAIEGLGGETAAGAAR